MDKKYIAVPGRLESVATDGQIAGTNQVYDDDRQKSQATINDEFESGQAYLDNKISALQKQDIEVVDTLPEVATADPKKIYRVTGTTSYTDYMLSPDGSQFKAMATYAFPGIDDEPTAGSDNLVKSGGIQNELALGAVYDVSAKNPTAGPNNDGKFKSLSALLSDANLNTLIPTTVRKGGMSIKFIQSSDNKYVQYMYVSTSTDIADFTNIANWEKVNIETDVQKEIGYEIIKAIVPGKYITTNTGVGNQIGKEASLTRFNYMRFYVQEGDIVIVNGIGGGAPRLWAFIDEDEKILSVANASISVSNLKIVAPKNSKECIINTEDISVPSVYISKNSINGRVAKLSNDAKDSMLHSKDWIVSGNVVYDNNEIPVSYDIVWADGTVGTVVNSNFNSDVYEYSTITATYDSDTVVYSLTFDDNGYIINETINIQ